MAVRHALVVTLLSQGMKIKPSGAAMSGVIVAKYGHLHSAGFGCLGGFPWSLLLFFLIQINTVAEFCNLFI